MWLKLEAHFISDKSALEGRIKLQKVTEPKISTYSFILQFLFQSTNNNTKKPLMLQCNSAPSSFKRFVSEMWRHD